MQIILIICLVASVLLSFPLLFMLFKKRGFYNCFAAILAMSANVTLFLMMIGFVDGRKEMYVDSALSCAMLGFVSSVIVAKFMSGEGGEKDDGN